MWSDAQKGIFPQHTRNLRKAVTSNFTQDISTLEGAEISLTVNAFQNNDGFLMFLIIPVSFQDPK